MREKAHVWCLVLFCAVLYLYGLGGASLWEIDEAIYAEVARQMLVRHDWVVPFFNGAPFFHKPPLTYWFTALSYQIFGVNEAAARLSAVLCGLGTVYATYRWGAALFCRRAGMYAAGILGVSLEFFALSRMDLMDGPLTLAITLALYYLWRGLDTAGWRYYLAAGLMVGLGILVKGPVALVLVSLTALVAWRQRLCRQMLTGRFWAGVLVLAAVAAAWYYAMWVREGQPFLAEHFGHQMVARFTTGLESHGQPWYYYLVVLLFGYWPWSVALPMALSWSARQARRPAVALPLVWSGVVIVFFSLARTKLPGYILPALVPLSLLVGAWWDEAVTPRAWRRPLWLMGGAQLAVAAAGAALVFVYHDRAPALYHPVVPAAYMLAAILAIGAAAVLLWTALARDKIRAFAGITVLCGVVLLALVQLVMPAGELVKPARILAPVIMAAYTPGDRIGSTAHDVQGLTFYTRRQVAYLAPGAVADFTAAPGRWFLLAEQRQAAALLATGDARVLAAHGPYVVLTGP